MEIMEERLLRPELLPQTLWDRDASALYLPPCLAAAYKTLIARHSLKALAGQRDANNPPVGGLSQGDTDKHFAQAFDGSAARTQLAILNPHGLTTSASNSFLACLAGNTVRLVDAPCGAGAASFAFLSTVAGVNPILS